MAIDNVHVHEPSERSPLLTSTPEANRPDHPKLKSWQTPERLTLLVFLAVLLVSLGDQWMDSPRTRIFEAIICYRYYEKVDPSKLLLDREAVGPGAIGGVAEMHCKVDAVQSDLAALRGWQSTFDGFPTLLLAVPLGWAADNYGRKPIVLLGLVAVILQAVWIQLVTWFWQPFDIRWIWLGSAFGSMGGGSPVLMSLVYVILSDITPETKRVAVFLRVGAFNVLAGLVMPAFAAVLMEINPWIPNLGGTVLEILSLILASLCAETLDYQHPSLPQNPDLSPPPAPLAETAPQFTDPDASRASIAMKTMIRKIRHSISSFSFLVKDWRIPVLILPFLCHVLVGAVGSLLLQYVSKRYEIKLSEAILLLTIRMGVIVLLLFSILPFLSNAVVRKFRLSAQRKDLYFARISFALIAVGWTLIGLSPNLTLLTIALTISSAGYGAWLMDRSFLTSIVSKNQIARVYSVINIVDTLGVIFGSPLMAGLFKRGLGLGGFWIGMPFYFLGLASGCFVLLLFLVGLRKGEDEPTVPEEDGQT